MTQTESNYVLVVASLEDVTPIPGADRIVSATARGYRLVVGANHKAGELGDGRDEVREREPQRLGPHASKRQIADPRRVGEVPVELGAGERVLHEQPRSERELQVEHALRGEHDEVVDL